MTTLYSNEVRDFIRSRDWPEKTAWKIAESDQPAPHLNIVFFRDNWLTLTFEEQFRVSTIVKEIMEKLWNDGIPIYVGKIESVYDGT